MQPMEHGTFLFDTFPVYHRTLLISYMWRIKTPQRTNEEQSRDGTDVDYF